jgi:hypothetical protein
MAMGPAVMGAVGLAGVNALILVVLSGVWVRNYRTFRSNLTLGLLAFGVVLLLENLVAIYFFFGMGSLYADSPLVGEAVLVLRGLQFLALAFLGYVTLQ